MLCMRFSLFVILIFSLNTFSQDKFTSKQCLDAKFETSIQQGKKFFGLINSNLDIRKEECILTVKYKYIMEKEWIVDICREPIHIKVSSTSSQEVFKRGSGCQVANQGDFCDAWNELSAVIQDYGLIYAIGKREELESSHGKTYCAFLLLSKYLSDGVLFSTYEEVPNLFSMGTCSIVSEKKNEVIQMAPEPVAPTNLEQPKELKLEGIKEESEDRF